MGALSADAGGGGADDAFEFSAEQLAVVHELINAGVTPSGISTSAEGLVRTYALAQIRSALAEYRRAKKANLPVGPGKLIALIRSGRAEHGQRLRTEAEVAHVATRLHTVVAQYLDRDEQRELTGLVSNWREIVRLGGFTGRDVENIGGAQLAAKVMKVARSAAPLAAVS